MKGTVNRRKEYGSRTVASVCQKLLCQPELQGSLLGARYLQKTHSKVSAVIAPDDLSLCFQCCSCAGKFEVNLKHGVRVEEVVGVDLHTTLADVDEVSFLRILSLTFDGDRNLESGAVVAKTSVHDHIAGC